MEEEEMEVEREQKLEGGSLKRRITIGVRRRRQGGLLVAFWFGFVTFLSVRLG